MFSEQRPNWESLSRNSSTAAKKNAFTVGSHITTSSHSLIRPRGGCARIKMHRVRRRRRVVVLAARRWCTLMAETSLTSGHEPSINSRRNWRFVYIKSGADNVTIAGATRVSPTNIEIESLPWSNNHDTRMTHESACIIDVTLGELMSYVRRFFKIIISYGIQYV